MDNREAIQHLIKLGQLPTAELVRELTSPGRLTGGEELYALQPSEKRVKIEEKGSSVEILQQFQWKPKKVKVDDAEEADKTFSTLMGSDVEPRKHFIQSHAKLANIDV